MRVCRRPFVYPDGALERSKKSCRNRCRHYSDSQRNVLAFGAGVPTWRRIRILTSRHSFSTRTSGVETPLLRRASMPSRRADLSSWASAVSRKGRPSCTSDLCHRIRCANRGNKTMCLRTGATVRAACANGGASLEACEKTLSLLNKTGGGHNERTNEVKAWQELCQGLAKPVLPNPNRRWLHAPRHRI